MSVMRDKLNWNAVKGFVRSVGAEKRIFIIVAVLVGGFIISYTYQGFWVWHWDFLDENTLLWFFSTLAQVFGALLGLLGVAIFFVIDKVGSLKEKHESLRYEYDEVREKVKGLREKIVDYMDKPKGSGETLEV